MIFLEISVKVPAHTNKNHGPKKSTPGCNLGPKFQPHVKENLTAVPSIYKEVHDLMYYHIEAFLLKWDKNHKIPQ